MNTRRSIIWKASSEEFRTIVSSSTTMSEILKYFGFKNKGANYKTVKTRIKEENIDASHIATGKGATKGRAFGGHTPIPLSDVLIEGSVFNRTHLKKRLLREKLLKNYCYKCNQNPEWNGEHLVLILDHINGVSDDNRLNNLRLLCPNCNSQTPTFAGRNNGKSKNYKP